MYFRWWRDLYRCVGLNYARDRLVEGYIWCYAVYHEKEFALSRIFLTKQLMLISLMDDTYDAHAHRGMSTTKCGHTEMG